MRHYENLVIVKPTLTAEEIQANIKAIEEVITSNGGEIAATSAMGMRKLAYPIEKNERGYYHVIYYSVAPSAIVEIERRLIEELDIPVFHDDQHGTAIVTTAAIINSCKLLGKKIEDLKVCMIGTGSAGSSIARMVKGLGVKSLYAYNSKGVVTKDKYDKYRFLVKELLDQGIIDTPANLEEDSVAGMIKGTDVFIGVSAPNMVTKEMVKSMNPDPIILAMANPTPEIMPEDALEAGAAVVGTGRSDYPNQVNNVLAFPGLFKGALEAGATVINDEMKIAAAYGIANVLKEEELRADYIIPSPFDERVAAVVAETVKKIAIENNLIRKG